VISGHAIYVTLAWAVLAMALAVAAAVPWRGLCWPPAGRRDPRRRIDALPPRPAVTKIMLVLGIWPLTAARSPALTEGS
jgi:hypothetical protein